MAINGLSQYDLFSSYNSINSADRIPKAEPVGIEEQSKNAQTDTSGIPEQESAPQSLSLDLDSIRSRGNASLEDISLSLQSSSEFDMKGRDSNLGSLDMEKAVSDMQKDQALMQYQYFVGDSSNVISSGEDGTVVQKSSDEML
ncbi:MAG TPA: hypothetical protein PLU43_03105 [Lachnospiraceae bacterium]|nr:hypothetical protein [Lachnospiraceae bacterium]